MLHDPSKHAKPRVFAVRKRDGANRRAATLFERWTKFRFLTGEAPGIDGLKSVRAVAEDEPLAGIDFVAAEFGQAGVVSVQALEEEQQRIVAAPFEFVAD